LRCCCSCGLQSNRSHPQRTRAYHTRRPRLPHLHRDWAHPHATICTGTGLTLCHICTGSGLPPPTSAPGLGSPPATSAPGPQNPADDAVLSSFELRTPVRVDTLTPCRRGAVRVALLLCILKVPAHSTTTQNRLLSHARTRTHSHKGTHTRVRAHTRAVMKEFDAGCTCMRGWLHGRRCATSCSAPGAHRLRPRLQYPLPYPLLPLSQPCSAFQPPAPLSRAPLHH
jgi:hypothetical protein